MSMPIELRTTQAAPDPAAVKRSAKPDDPKKVHDAAQQFESLMIAQMLKSIREGSDSWLGTGDDTAGASAIELAEEQLANSISKSGGFGLAHMVEAGLGHASGRPASKTHQLPDVQKLKE